MEEKYFISMNLDGTLLDDDGNISEYTIQVLNECKKHKAKILINTSRSLINVPKELEKFDVDYLSCFNGNYIIANKNVINSRHICYDVLDEIIDYLLVNSCEFALNCLDGLFILSNDTSSFLLSRYIERKTLKDKMCFEIYILQNDNKLNNLLCKNNLEIVFDKNNNIYKIVLNDTNKVNALKKIKEIENDVKIISFGSDISDYESLCYSNVGIKMKNSPSDIDDIIFWTDNNNNNGVAKFLSNFYNLDMKVQYDKVKILDCTLRDGGHLNDCNFGYESIKEIIKKLVYANTDIIEIGFLENCIYDSNKSKFNTILEAENIVKDINYRDTLFSVLTQVDKYDIKKLTKCNGIIKLIRVSFHKGLLRDAINFCKVIKQKGYLCSLNPINFSGYNNIEIVELINEVNKLELDYFSIVDTFGMLLNNDFNNKLNLINNLLRSDINVGLHLHDNLSSSFSTAQILMQKNTRFGEVIIDSSLLGMGRDPGNLKTELLMYYLNKENNKYNMKYIYELLQFNIYKLRKQYNWGYDFAYSISAFEKTHRSYSEYLKNKKYSYEKIEKYIKEIPIENRTRYSEKIIEQICLKGD